MRVAYWGEVTKANEYGWGEVIKANEPRWGGLMGGYKGQWTQMRGADGSLQRPMNPDEGG